eukprot:1711348-Amphidinium_carterae.1
MEGHARVLAYREIEEVRNKRRMPPEASRDVRLTPSSATAAAAPAAAKERPETPRAGLEKRRLDGAESKMGMKSPRLSPGPSAKRSAEVDVRDLDVERLLERPDDVGASSSGGPGERVAPPRDDPVGERVAPPQGDHADADVQVMSLSPAQARREEDEKQKIYRDWVEGCLRLHERDASRDDSPMRLRIWPIFSPPRFTEAAAQYRLKPGVAVDLVTGWDLLRPEHEQELERVQSSDLPWLLTVSPRCDPFSPLLNLSARARSDESRDQQQYDGGRHFLHEHPRSETSWREPCIQELIKLPGVVHVDGAMCRWEMQLPEKYRNHPDSDVPEYVKKPTGWITNCPMLADVLGQGCSNDDGNRPQHNHSWLIGGVAKFAARYPPKLVAAVLRALRQQLRHDGTLNSLEELSGPYPEHEVVPEHWRELLDEGGKFYDDVHGGILDSKLVIAARALELEWIHREG